MTSNGQKAELLYFNGRGLAEITRLTLAVAGIEFNEVDLATREEFVALQPDLLFGQLPLLRIDGLNIIQSGAIVRHVARKGKLLGSNDLETARIEMIFDGTRDFYLAFLKMHWIPEDKLKPDIEKIAFPKYLPVFNKLLGDSSSGFLVGDSLSLADLGLLEILLTIFDYWREDALQDYPNVLTFYRKLTSHDRVINYIKNIRKAKNDETYVTSVRTILSHLNL